MISLYRVIYNCFINNLIYRKYNYIDKFDFLEDYQYIQLEIFQSNTIRNNFTASSIVLVNTEKIFSKFNISLQISILPNSRSDSRSSQFIPQISKTVIQLFKQISILKNLLKQ